MGHYIKLVGGSMLKINAMYFSATNTTERVVKNIADNLALKFNGKVNYIDFTLAKERKSPVCFAENDLVVVGVPVYAGRVPNVLISYLNSVKSHGSIAVATVVYGNRNYDDALMELSDILEVNGFNVVAAGAFIGEHSFSYKLAAGRPDEDDLKVAGEFADKIYEKICSNVCVNVEVPGNRTYSPHYRPKDAEGNFVDIRKVKPKTSTDCVQCKLCCAVCPMESIDYNDVATLKGICIKCGACIKKCPVKAKYYDDENYLRHKKELEEECSERREIELFLK